MKEILLYQHPIESQVDKRIGDPHVAEAGSAGLSNLTPPGPRHQDKFLAYFLLLEQFIEELRTHPETVALYHCWWSKDGLTLPFLPTIAELRILSLYRLRRSTAYDRAALFIEHSAYNHAVLGFYSDESDLPFCTMRLSPIYEFSRGYDFKESCEILPFLELLLYDRHHTRAIPLVLKEEVRTQGW